MILGTCRLCGKETDLSFEHVPPKITFNKHTKYKEVPFQDYLTSENPLKNPPKGKTKQGGVGYNSYCKDCNSFLGASYVPAYKRWALGGKEILKNVEIELHEYVIKEIEPQKILKQIISMFLAINDVWYLESHRELSKYVSDPESKILPDRYKVFCYLTRAERLRYMNHTVVGNFGLHTPINCSEIAFPPYGYVLTIDHNDIINQLTEITKFKHLEGVGNLNFKMYQLPTYMPFPLDYRTKDKIEMDIERSIEEGNKDNGTSS